MQVKLKVVVCPSQSSLQLKSAPWKLASDALDALGQSPNSPPEDTKHQNFKVSHHSENAAIMSSGDFN